jgi:hypothetical protein
VRAVTSVAIQNIVYQLPPPPSVAPLATFRQATLAGRASCGWRCPYETIRSAMAYRRELVGAARSFLAAARQRHGGDDARAMGALEMGSGGGASGAAERVRVLAVHWRRGDFLGRSDEATGEALLDSKSGKPCVRAAVVLSPSQLAEEVRDALARHNSSLVFLASNAKPEEVTALEQQLSGIPVVRYEPPPSATPPARSYTAPELAVLDTLVCARGTSWRSA